MPANDRQLTNAPYGHILTNIGCWSPDGQWLYYDTRSDAAGSQFDGRWIERVHIESGRVQRLVESQRGAHCGVVTCCPRTERIVFILGPEAPTAQWQYAPYHRRGVIFDTATFVPGKVVSQDDLISLDAMCYEPPFVPGALRGGSHVHTFDPRGQRVAYTYEDHVLASMDPANNASAERNQRNVGVSSPGQPVKVARSHPRNHSGSHFSTLVTHTLDHPQAGTDQIDRAYEDSWLGPEGRALAFLGDIVGRHGGRLTELFVLDLPEDLTMPGPDGPLEGTATTRPNPPLGVRQRRLTFTEEYPHPGISPPRHWPRSTPDGQFILFLMRDAQGIAQLWNIRASGGSPQQITQSKSGVSSTFSVSADGDWVSYLSDHRVCISSIDGLTTRVLTPPAAAENQPRPEASVFSPDGQKIAYVRRIGQWNQICVHVA